MGNSSSRYHVDDEIPGNNRKMVESQISRGAPILVLNCGCSQRTVPDDSQYQYFDWKSDENIIPRAQDYYATHPSSPPYIGSSYGDLISQETDIVHIVSPDLTEEIEANAIEQSVVISLPSALVMNTQIGLTSRIENNKPAAFTKDGVFPRKLFDGDVPEMDVKCDSDSAANVADEEDEDEEDDFDIINPHSFDKLSENNVGNRQLPCHLLIPRCTSISSEFPNMACLSLSLKTNYDFPRNCSARTSPTLEATESDSSMNSVDLSVGDVGIEPTLPCFEHGKPIQLKVTEKYKTASHTLDPRNLGPDCFSYDPYFNLGEYAISDTNGQPYGDGLQLNMAGQYMCLQDNKNRVWAVTRNRCTFLPSYVLYAPIPRYEGQSPSTHRIMNDIHLYPWALIRKEGRRVDHDITVHMAMEGDASILLDGQFETRPSYRTRQRLDHLRNHSHSVMYKVSDDDVAKPCCLFSRQINNRNTFDVTIAPGIDPLFMICSLAVQCKMDLEPKLNN